MDQTCLGLSGGLGIRAEKLDLNPHLPQPAVSGKENGRAERFGPYGNVVHHRLTWG